jgi:hypothetical protein
VAGLDACEVDPPVDGPLQGPYVREVREESHGTIPRLDIIITIVILLP